MEGDCRAHSKAVKESIKFTLLHCNPSSTSLNTLAFIVPTAVIE